MSDDAQSDSNLPEPAIKVAVVPVTPFQQNASIVWCTATQQAVVVDPGGDLPRLLH
jgi:glyoxylase-like metal-dependent hydrolase (beta-lactamase superfamily II)